MNHIYSKAWKFMMIPALLSFSLVAYAGPHIQAVNNGQIPYQSFSGSINASTQQDLLTIPSDQVFVVTTCITNNNYMDIRQDGTIKLERRTSACQHSYGTAFTTGNAHLIIDSGTVLNIKTSGNGSVYYYIEGFFAKP